MQERERETSDETRLCPFCRDDIVLDTPDLTSCGQCATWQHAECWSSHGACSTCGYDEQAKPLKVTAHARLAPQEEDTWSLRARALVGLLVVSPFATLFAVAGLLSPRFTGPTRGLWVAGVVVAALLLSLLVAIMLGRMKRSAPGRPTRGRRD